MANLNRSSKAYAKVQYAILTLMFLFGAAMILLVSMNA